MNQSSAIPADGTKVPCIVEIRANGNHLSAANDEREPDLTPEDVEAEVRRIEADKHNLVLKNSGVLEQRRVAYAHRNDVELDGWPK